MKKLILISVLSLLTLALNAQVYSGSLEIDGLKKEGFYIYIKGSDEAIFNSWKNFIRNYGAIDKAKNSVLTASNTRIPDAEKKSYTLISKVIWENEKTKLFVSLEGQGKEIVKSGHEDYRLATNWVEQFSQIFQLEEGVRAEEGKLENLKKNKYKLEKTSERLVREMEANQRQTDLLNKKLEEAKIEKEKIITNQLQNKKDLQMAEEALIQQQKQVDTAKQKIK